MTCPLCHHRVAFWRSIFVETRRGTLRCPSCGGQLQRARYFRPGRTRAILLYLVAFVVFDWVLSAVLPEAWATSFSRVLWPVGLLWLGALYVELEPARKA